MADADDEEEAFAVTLCIDVVVDDDKDDSDGGGCCCCCCGCSGVGITLNVFNAFVVVDGVCKWAFEEAEEILDVIGTLRGFIVTSSTVDGSRSSGCGCGKGDVDGGDGVAPFIIDDEPYDGEFVDTVAIAVDSS